MKCPHINSPPGLALSQAGLKEWRCLTFTNTQKPLVFSLNAKAGSLVLECKALGLILRLACDLPTMERMLETLCILFSSAWRVRRKDGQTVRTRSVYKDYMQRQRYARSHPKCWSRVHTLYTVLLD